MIKKAITDELPLFTVIIPVKDRSKYLYHTLRTCTNQEYKNLEIIVSDDGSTDNTREMVEAFIKIDSRIKYISPDIKRSVGMLDNFEFALDHVKPGFVIALGGDDGLLPNSINKMWDILKETKMELLSWPTAAFFYPCQKTKNGQIIFQMKNIKSNFSFQIKNSDAFLERQSKNLFYIADLESPMIYVKGVVSTNLINRVRKRSPEGKFYTCSTPDGFSGIVLAGEVNQYVFCGKPLTIHGVSPTSQGLGYLTKNETAKTQSEDFFKKSDKIPMHKELASQPYSPLISLMTADFLLTTRDLPGWPGKYTPFNYKKLLSIALKELEDGLYPEDRINRELNILHNIANQHGLSKYFDKLLKNSKRNSRRPLEGNAISPRLLYLDAKDFDIHNIFEASYFVYNFHNFTPKLKFNFFFKMLFNSLRYRFLSFNRNKKISNFFIIKNN